MKTRIIKVCGMTDAGNIRETEALGIDLMGFIFYSKSPRFVAREPSYMPHKAQRTGVFVDEDFDFIIQTARQYGLKYIQLHGHESPALCRRLSGQGYGVIKSFAPESPQDMKQPDAYEGACSLFLFDTKDARHGGTGQRFDWTVLRHYRGNTPYLLSGGIDMDCILRIHAMESMSPLLAGVDLNSRFETSPGIKDTDKLRRFIKAYTQDIPTK